MEKEVKAIVWSALAIKTLHIIYDYIADQSVREADKQIERILESTDILAKGWAKTGQRQPIRSSKAMFQYRYLVQDNYKVIYHETDTEILIDLVFDTRQNPKKLKRLLGLK